MLLIDGQSFLHQSQCFLGIALRQCFRQALIRDIIGVPILGGLSQLDGLSQQSLALTDAVVGKSSLSLLQTTCCRLSLYSLLLLTASSHQNAYHEYVQRPCKHCYRFFVSSRLQSYDIFSKVVSVTYGKDEKERKQETSANQ